MQPWLDAGRSCPGSCSCAPITMQSYHSTSLPAAAAYSGGHQQGKDSHDRRLAAARQFLGISTSPMRRSLCRGAAAPTVKAAQLDSAAVMCGNGEALVPTLSSLLHQH